jgi:hypothetical protein
MKNKVSLILILAVVLVAVVFNVVLGLVAPELFFSTPVFTVAWIFTFPVNIVLTIATLLYVLVKNREIEVRFPPMLYGTCIFSAIYFILGAIFMFTGGEKTGLPLAVEILITVIYVIYLLLITMGVGYIESAQRYTKRKVQYIGLLEADVKSILPYVKDNEALSKKLTDLAEKIRFSDPMSHESLSDCEEKISRAVMNLIMSIKTTPEADLSQEFTEIEALLEYRNARCLILKK